MFEKLVKLWQFASPAVFLAALTLAGCGASDTPTASQPNPPANQNLPTTDSVPNVVPKSDSTPKDRPAVEPAANNPAPNRPAANPPVKNPGDKPRILGDLLDDKEFEVRRMSIDEGRMAAAGIRKLTSEHLVLFTDLPVAAAVDELPAIFDLAIPQWCEYFAVDPAKIADWRMTAFLIKDEERFIGANVFPEEVRGFLNGYQRGYEMWLYEQPSDYYRRHLLLHEGTHGFMNHFLGGIGPPWYGEGVAELLGTHRWDAGKLTLRYNPRDNDEVPYWGRVRAITDQFANKKGLVLPEIFAFSPTAHRQSEPYAWCWAAAFFFDNHPAYQARFRAMHKQLRLNVAEFNRDFLTSIKDDWVPIQEQWYLLVEELVYGYDMPRAAISYQPGEQLPSGGKEIKIRADRGWQSSGIHLEEGRKYKITATGRYQVGADPKPWWCEPNGVTIDYYRGHPLGILTAAIRDDTNPIPSAPYLSKSAAIGLGSEITPTWSGTLYLRINESPAHLADNDGQLTIQVQAQ